MVVLEGSLFQVYEVQNHLDLITLAQDGPNGMSDLPMSATPTISEPQDDFESECFLGLKYSSHLEIL